MIEPYRECPRFARCSAPICPLDPERDKRDEVSGDERCSLPKARRTKIAAAHLDVLPWRGLWPRELAWEAMSPEQKARMAEGRRRGFAAILARKATPTPLPSELPGGSEAAPPR